MPALTANLLRLICNADRPDRALDQRTGQSPVILRGFNYRVQLGAFVDGILVDDVTNWESVTLEVRALTDGAVDHDSAPLITKTVSTGFAVPEAAEWNAKTAQHAEIALSVDETAIAAGDMWLSIFVTTTDDPVQQFFLAYGNARVIDSGASNSGTPPANLGDYYLKAEADARFAQRAPALGAYRIKTTGDGSQFLQLKDAVTGKFRSLWLENGVEQLGAEED